MEKKKVLVLPGSTRAESGNGKILAAIIRHYDAHVAFDLYGEAADLPHFDPAVTEDAMPAIVTRVKDKIRTADAVLIATPEYIFAMPALLKNLFEWTVSDTVFSYKPVAFIVASADG